MNKPLDSSTSDYIKIAKQGSSKNSEKKSQKSYAKSLSLWYRILIRLKEGQYPSQIARQLHTKKQNILYHVSRLLHENYIELDSKDAITTFRLTPKGNEFLIKLKLDKKLLKHVSKLNNIRNHNLAVKIPIIKDNPNADFSKELNYHEQMKGQGHWKTKYFTIAFPIGMTIEKNPKNVIINFHKFETDQNNFFADFANVFMRGVLYVTYHFAKKYDISLDSVSGEVIRFHLANEKPDLNDKVQKHAQISVGLNRKSKVIFPTNIDAKAWLDRSHGNVEIETNDLVYEEKLLLMPEKIFEFANLGKFIIEQQHDFAKNLKLHKSTLQKMNSTLDKISDTLEQLVVYFSKNKEEKL